MHQLDLCDTSGGFFRHMLEVGRGTFVFLATPTRFDEDLLISRLVPDERRRAARFQRPHDRKRFIVARALLRTALGDLLQVPPGSISLAYGRYGKPYLTPGRGLDFNISHADDRVAIAVTTTGIIGVDIEYIAPGRGLDQLIHRIMPGEQSALLQLSRPALDQALHLVWCYKEAVAKAVGLGLRLSLASFTVPVETSQGAGLVTDVDAPLVLEGRQWSLNGLHFGDNYVMAVALGYLWQEGAIVRFGDNLCIWEFVRP